MNKNFDLKALSPEKLLSFLSHELNTPINGILGSSSLLLETELNEEQILYTASIDYSAQNLHRMIKNMLDLTRIELGSFVLHPEQVDLSVAVLEAYHGLKFSFEQKSINLTKTINKVPHISVDRDRTLQVTTAVINQAVRFSFQKNMEITLNYENNKHDFSVIDSGQNFSLRKKIFDNLKSGNSPEKLDAMSFELLYILKMAEELKADVSFEGVEGSNARFTLKLI